MTADLWCIRCRAEATVHQDKAGKYWTLRAACPTCGAQMTRWVKEEQLTAVERASSFTTAST